VVRVTYTGGRGHSFRVAAARFGDVDPEDAYDASDPIPTRLFVIGQIVDALAREPDPDRRRVRRDGVVRLLTALTDEVATGGQ
jgi:hypothetical protein